MWWISGFVKPMVLGCRVSSINLCKRKEKAIMYLRLLLLLKRLLSALLSPLSQVAPYKRVRAHRIFMFRMRNVVHAHDAHKQQTNSIGTGLPTATMMVTTNGPRAATDHCNKQEKHKLPRNLHMLTCPSETSKALSRLIDILAQSIAKKYNCLSSRYPHFHFAPHKWNDVVKDG